MLTRTLILLAALLACACDDPADRMARGAGPQAAYAHGDAVAADTFPTVARRLLPDFEGPGAPTPDGRRVVVTDWETGDIAVQNLATGELRRITRNTAPYDPGYGMMPKVSRDGQRVAYHWDPLDGRNTQLRVAEIDGSGERTIHDDDATSWIQPEDWSPDGRSVLAWRDLRDGLVQILIVPVDGGEVRVLKTFEHDWPVGVKFSHDGRFVAFDFQVDADAAQRDIAVIDLGSGRETVIASGPADDYVLGWTPDGAHILFSSDRAGTPGAWLLPVENGRAAGEPLLVKPDVWRAEPAGFTADGSFYYSVRTGGRNIFTASFDPRTGRIAGSPTRITRHALPATTWLDWSPDGRSIAYVAQEAPPVARRRSLVIRSIETGEVRSFRLPPRLYIVTQLRWTRDGRALFLRVRDESNRFGLVRVDAQTGQVGDLFMLEHEHVLLNFYILPDDRSIVYRRNTTRESGIGSAIVLRDLTSGAERVLHEEASNRNLLRMVASGDRRTVAVLRRTGDASRELLLLRTDGGEPHRIPDVELPADTRGEPELSAFTPDGEHLLILRTTDEGVREAVRIPLQGGPGEPTGLAMEQLGMLHVDPSGERIAFVTGTTGGELWVMSGFLPGNTTEASDSDRP